MAKALCSLQLAKDSSGAERFVCHRQPELWSPQGPMREVALGNVIGNGTGNGDRDQEWHSPFLNMGPVTKVTVAVINLAIWVNEVRKSWIFNFLWKAGTWIQGYHTLTVCFWSYFNNGTYCEEMTPGEIFSQPFTQLFGPTPPVFEGFKSLNVNDIIQWLVLLVCLFCLAFRDKGRLTWITTLIPTLENKDAAPQPEPVPQPDPAPQPDTVPQPASGINHPDWVKEICEMGQMLREDLGKPSSCPNKGESDGAAAEPTDVTTVQVPAEPQGQPQPAAVAPVETKKYKVKSEHTGNKDKKGGPSQPGEESEVEIITESLTYESLRNLQKDLARRGREAYTAWLLQVWDLIGTGVQLDSSEARNLGPLTQDSGVNQVFVREPGPLSLWERLLMSVRERFVHRDRMQEHHHRMRWKTLEEGIQQLREVAVLEVLFGRGGQHDNDPDKVKCTGQMLWNLATLGPSQYATYIATIHPDTNQETVGSVANKLRNYESIISSPMKAQVSAVAKELRERMEEVTEEIREGEARENRVYWTVWIRWPGTSEPQKYEALVDTGSQCTLIPSEYVGTEPISIAGVTGGSQELTLLEAEGFRWAFGIAAVEAEGIKKLNSLPGLSENPSAVGLLKVEEQRVPVATSTVHRRQYRTNRDAVIPIHKMIRELESQGVVSKTHSPFNSPIWPVRKSDGEWRLTVDYRALNEVTPPLSAAVPDMLELQYELESRAAKWYATIDIANAFFSIPLAAECRPQFAFTWRGVQYTWNRLPQGWKHSPTICHGLIQAALEKGEAPEHLQYIDDIIVWGNTAMEVFEKGEKIIQILLKAGFAIKQSKVKGPAREIQFLGVKWQDGRRQIPTEVINKITAMSPPTSKKETQAFLGAIGFWRMHIPEYSQIVSPLYLVTRKKNDFHWGPEQQQAFAQIKQEIAHAVALGPVRTGPEVKNVLYSAARNNGLSWSLWQKVPGETRGRPLGFWSRSYRGSEANYTPTEKEILAAYEGVQAASEVIGTEAQLLLAPRLPVLGWMFKGKVPSTHHATDATWSKWIALITQRARIGNPNRPGILEIITNWPEGENFGLMDEEEQEQVTRAEEAPPYNQLPAEETRYALFTDGSCRVVGINRKWKAAVWSPTRQVAQATEGEGGSSQLAELKAVQLALDIAEREKWPKLYLYTDSWMVANALWGWLDRWRKANWQRRGKPIWAADEWKDIAARVEKLPVKVRHVDAHVPKSRANEEHQNNEQVDQAAKIEVSKIDLDWQHKGELFLARWAHDASGHQGRDATYKWAQDRGVDLTMDSISQVIHDCETCAAIKQAKRVKPLWYGGRWSKYKYGEAWQIDYITLPQTRQGKRYVLTMVEATTGWLETYPVPHATARNTILGLEKQILWRHGTPERIESDNGTHFKNSLINTWAREHGIEWVYHIPYHAPAAGKVERCNGLLKTTLKALGAGTFKNWENNLAKATWLVNTRGSTNRAGPTQSEPLGTRDGDKVPVVHMRGMLGKTVWINSASSKDNPAPGVVFAQGPGCTWWVMQKDGETRCIPQGDLVFR
ncbi:hypothetical protein DUI87_34316 [Hirundo rustica rustica]|uniref:ribonuclease H n=1 Tax=Hirundo rustica rustica TaxID=333673 RepID=A0A3M0IKS0_HIRRU|nr:hypothetical protein DUI87_34316 [Hirundo rustica rustica]